MCASTESDVWTIGRLLSWTRSRFASKGVDQPRLSAELLLAHALGCRKIDLYTRFDEPPMPDQTAHFRRLVKEASELKPVAYLTGVKEFYSLEFQVTPDVLIPRPETEALVARATEVCSQHTEGAVHVLDIGTGSGCIAVAVCKFVDRAHCVATDGSVAALAVARRNVERHGLSDRITLIQADGPDLPSDSVPHGGFDLVLSNPPYVSEDAQGELAENVRRYEPHAALYAGGDGLRFYRMFARGVPAILAPRGTLLVEIAAWQEASVSQEFARAGGWEHRGTHRDGADPHPRVMEFRRTGG